MISQEGRLPAPRPLPRGAEASLGQPMLGAGLARQRGAGSAERCGSQWRAMARRVPCDQVQLSTPLALSRPLCARAVPPGTPFEHTTAATSLHRGTGAGTMAQEPAPWHGNRHRGTGAHTVAWEPAPWHGGQHRGTGAHTVAWEPAPWHGGQHHGTGASTVARELAGSRRWLPPALQVRRRAHAEALLHSVLSTRWMLKITGISIPGRSWGPLAAWEPLRPAGEVWGNTAISAPASRGAVPSGAGRGWRHRPRAPARAWVQGSPRPWGPSGSCGPHRGSPELKGSAAGGGGSSGGGGHREGGCF